MGGPERWQDFQNSNCSHLLTVTTCQALSFDTVPLTEFSQIPREWGRALSCHVTDEETEAQ